MNYRHIYHAGNLCDIAKHAILALVLKHLQEKEKPFFVLDTHAGIGLYDLDDPRSQKTGEADQGIKTLLQAPALPMLSRFYDVLRKMNPNWKEGVEGFRVYPGSPLIAFHMLRADDRLVACELHPDDAQALRLSVPIDKRVQIHKRDGYEALGAFLPPPEKRGLVLIDPPYEEVDEFETAVKRVREAHQKWPTGIYAIWYPVKDRPAIWGFHEALATTGIPKILCTEFVYDEEVRADKLCGSGMILINPPWKLDEEIGGLFPQLHKVLKTGYAGSTVKWLSADA